MPLLGVGWAVAVAAAGAMVALFSGEERAQAAGSQCKSPWAQAAATNPASRRCCCRRPAGNLNFAPGACERLEPHLASRVVGQELALRQLADAVCDHLGRLDPPRPLVLSVHGPPGVGKSMSHLLAAQALYSRHPDKPGLQCPGRDCAGYKVGGRGARGLCWLGGAGRAGAPAPDGPGVTPDGLPTLVLALPLPGAS